MKARNVLLVGLVFVMVNLPLVHGAWQEHRVRTSGLDVVATVTEHRPDVVTFEVPERGDQPGFEGTARLTPTAYRTAVDDGQLEVRVLPGSTTVWEAEGEVGSRLMLLVTLVADVLLLLAVVLLWLFGSRLRAELVVEATADLERCPPGPGLDLLDGDRVELRGEVETVEDDAVVLDLGDRRVRVLLAGHHNPAGRQQPVRVTGRIRP